MKYNQLNLRGLTSLITSAGFLILAVSGIVSYVVPHGRIAYWTNWRFLGLTKTNWADIHLLGSLLFLVAAAVHIYLNWRPLTGYFVDRVKGGIGLRKEIGITILLVLFVVFSAVYHIPPMSYVADLGEHAKNSWVSREYEPPFGRAELLSLQSFCKKQDIPLVEALKELEKNGIRIASTEASLADTAKSNGTTPLKLYMIVQPLEGKAGARVETTSLTPEAVEEKFAGSGIGRKTLSEIASSMKFDPARVRTRLVSMKLEVKTDEPLKQAAERNGLPPIELLKAVLIEGYKPQK